MLIEQRSPGSRSWDTIPRIDDEDKETATLGMSVPEARVPGILAALPDLMFIVSRDLVFEAYQAPDPDKLLMPPSAFIGKRVDEVVPPDVARRVEEAVVATLSDGQRRTVPYSFDLPDGRQWFEAISGVCDENSVLFVVRDRTRQVLVEERLRNSDRMASLGMLASGVAHEINNPLTYVLGNLEILRAELEPNASAEIRGAFDDVSYGLEQVKALISDLRVFSHPGQSKREAVDVDHVIDATLRIARSALSHRAALSYPRKDVPAVLGNASQIGQVILNLVTNAIDAIEPGPIADNEVRVETTFDDETVTVSVSDTGVGIPPELRERIFDPFVTSKDVGSGTGLGLAICRSITESLGGSIRAQGREPRGTTVSITLRRHDGAADSGARPDADAAPKPHSAAILLVDDDPRVAEIAARALDHYDVTTVHSGGAALEALRGSQRFDVVLCDLMMPGMTGMELYRAVENEAPKVAARFVFMTGAAFSDDAREFVKATARPLLQKPFDMAAVRSTVADQL